MHLRNPSLRAAFGIGFCILFVFIGTFTYVDFVLVREPLSLSPMTLGLVYLVFLPSVITTPFAGVTVQQLGTRPTFWISLAIAGLGPLLLLLPNFPGTLLGLTLIGVGTFLAQAAATGFVGRPQPHTAARQAGSISLRIFSAASSAASCSGDCSIASDGRPASAGLRSPWPSRPRFRSG